MEKTQPILKTTNLSKTFSSKDGSIVKANDDINLEVFPGETLGIVGESGCGKSTLIKQLVGILEPTDGEILFNGKKVTDMSKSEKKEIHKEIQMIFQDPSLAFNPRLKIGSIITEPLINHKLIKRNQRKKVAEEYLELVGLPKEFVNRYPHELSGGQRQRVGIARALTLKPKVILCDEITSALDVSVQAEILELLKKIQEETGVSYIFITHDLALVEQLANRTAVMKDGKIVEMLGNKDIRKTAQHPYTKQLLDAVFEPEMRHTKNKEKVA